MLNNNCMVLYLYIKIYVLVVSDTWKKWWQRLPGKPFPVPKPPSIYRVWFFSMPSSSLASRQRTWKPTWPPFTARHSQLMQWSPLWRNILVKIRRSAILNILVQIKLWVSRSNAIVKEPLLSLLYSAYSNMLRIIPDWVPQVETWIGVIVFKNEYLLQAVVRPSHGTQAWPSRWESEEWQAHCVSCAEIVIYHISLVGSVV